MTINFSDFDLSKINPENSFEQKILDFIKDWFSDCESVPVQTSGSTGTPKVFEIEKSRMVSSARMTCEFLGLKNGNSALLCLPIEYISGKMMVVRAIETSLKLHIANPEIAALKNLDEQIDFCAMTPLQVENNLDKIHLIKNLIIGGAAISESLKKKIAAVLNGENSKVFETYGMSETLSHIALKQIFPVAESYFKLMNDVEISKGERGCLRIFAPKLNPGFLQTSDLVEIKDGNEFRFLGRLDNVINSGGAKIFPEELEALIKTEIPNEAVFVGIPDEVLGQKLVLIIEGNEDSEILNKIKYLNFEKSFHRPKEILFKQNIPRTPNGKVDRKQLLANLTKN